MRGSLNGNSYNKAMKAHFLMDETIVQHAFPCSQFKEEGLPVIKRFVNNACNKLKGIDSTDIPIAEMC